MRLALSTRRCRAVKPCSEEKVDKDLIYEWGSMAISVTEKKKRGRAAEVLSDAVKPGAGHEKCIHIFIYINSTRA